MPKRVVKCQQTQNNRNGGSNMNSGELAKAVAYELLSGGSVWLFLLITALFAGAGAYFGKYLGTKGANLATKEDFNNLQDQLSASTRLVEGVKSEIARTDWVAREWDALRIKKIEELMTIMHESEIYFDAKRNAFIKDEFHPDTPPFDQAIIISELYLPELTNAVGRYIYQCRGMVVKMNELWILKLDAKAKKETKTIEWEDYIEVIGYQDFLSTAKTIRNEARQLLEIIVLNRNSGSVAVREL